MILSWLLRENDYRKALNPSRIEEFLRKEKKKKEEESKEKCKEIQSGDFFTATNQPTHPL